MSERAAKRSGSVALIGRPNAGKSTLMNLMLAEKLAIVSDKPQTTRQRIVGILTEARGQMVFLDTPGVHRPQFRMNRRMVQAAVESLDEADVVCLVVDVTQKFGGGDRYAIDLLRRSQRPKLALLNKIDLIRKSSVLPMIEQYAELGVFEEIVPISALTGDGVRLVVDLLWERLPEGEPRYDQELLSVHTERFLVAERIREKVLEQTRDELPFATAVLIDQWEEREAGPIHIAATILVEKSGQKKILVGKGGSRIKSIGTAARLDLEEYLERSVYLDLYVREKSGWREDARTLAELEQNAVAADLEPF